MFRELPTCTSGEQLSMRQHDDVQQLTLTSTVDQRPSARSPQSMSWTKVHGCRWNFWL